MSSGYFLKQRGEKRPALALVVKIKIMEAAQTQGNALKKSLHIDMVIY